MPHYVAFVDLLATKESANLPAREFYQAMAAFSQTAAGAAGGLSRASRMYIFSDCAYIESRSMTEVAQFVRTLRKPLFLCGRFFKGAVVAGQLEPKPLKRATRSEGATVSGVVFGPGSVPAYLLHERFKGIGVAVEPLSDDPTASDETVMTAYPEGDGRRFSVCRDVRYSAAEIGGLYSLDSSKRVRAGSSCDWVEAEEDEDDEGGVLEEEYPLFNSMEDGGNEFVRVLIHNMIKSKVKSARYGRYYISTLISIVNSSDFSKLEYAKPDGWANFPIIFKYLFLSRTIEAQCGDVAGCNLVYFAAVNQIFRSSKLEEAALLDLVSVIVSRPKLYSHIGSVPPEILAHEHRERFIELATRMKLRGRRR